MSDDTPPHGIVRPSLADLVEHDEYTQIARSLTADIRGQIAAAKDRAAVWEPSHRPRPDAPHPLPLPGRVRGTRSHRAISSGLVAR